MGRKITTEDGRQFLVKRSARETKHAVELADTYRDASATRNSAVAARALDAYERYVERLGYDPLV